MRRHKLLALIFSLVLLAVSSAHAGEDHEKLLDRGLNNDEPYSYSLVKEAAGAQNRLELLEEALKFSPDVPPLYFKLSWASLPGVFKSVQYWIAGLKAYARNFWWSFSLLGLVYASLLISLIIAAALVVAVRLPLQIPLLAHDINEGKLKLLLPLLLVPVALGGPVFFIAGALVVVGISFKKLNKLVVYLVLAAIVVSPVLITIADGLLTTATSTEVKAIIAVNEGRDNTYAFQALKDRSSAEARFSYALALKREGRYDEAIAIYSELAGEDPSNWKVINNLGNAYSARGQPDLAKEAYEKAEKINPSAVVIYNLSQVYRGTLDFATGDKYYQDASNLDRDVVSKYTSLSSKNPNRFVIDVPYSEGELWGLALKSPGKVISPYPIGTISAAGLAAGLLVLFVVLNIMVKSKAFRCSRCDRIVCNICSRDSRWGQMCPDCYGSLVKIKDADRKKRVSALLSAYGHKERIRNIVRVLSFLPPGIAQIYAGRALGGMLLLWAFSFCAVALWLNPFLGTGLAGLSHGWLNLPLILAMVVLYLSSTIYINGRLESGWL